MISSSKRPAQLRAPTPSEVGLDVTIGIVAIAAKSLVAVSDQRFSYYDVFPPNEQGATKIVQITADMNWFMSFAATDIALFIPLLRKIRSDLVHTKFDTRSLEQMMETTAVAYSDIRLKQFAADHLVAIGYKTVDEFQQEGFQHLGKDEHARHMKALYEYDLGVELIIFGRCAEGPRMFKVCNPGKPIEAAWEGYAAIGSGSYLALGSLRQRPMPFDLPGTIYRVLEAKFVAEAASHVGKTTNVLLIRPNGTCGEIDEETVQKVRSAWEAERKRTTPEEAMSVILESHAIKLLDVK